MRALQVKESYGSGFSMGGGFTRGMMGRGGGFGGASNLGGPNMMYTYEIKPLNTLLTQKQNKTDDIEDIHIGLSIRGKKLNHETEKYYSGHVTNIVKTERGAIKYYEILDKTGTKIKLNPTSAVIASNTPLMNDLNLKDVYGDEPSEQKPKIKEHLVAEDLDELLETHNFEKGLNPKKAMKIGIKNRLSEDEIFDVVNTYCDDAEQSVFQKYPEKYTHKQYDDTFNDYIREKEPRLKYDKRNFYKIFCKYGPQ
jgi:hypothetical protein